MLIDTHAHLDLPQFDRDRVRVIARAREEGIQVITVGIDLGSSGKAVRLAKGYKIHAAVGIHPHEAKRYAGDLEGTLAKLEELARAERVVAIGEIGLDYYRDLSPREAQLRIFRAQLELAERLGLPVIVHDREADEDSLAVLRETDVQGVVHSFSSPLKVAEELLRLGLYLGFSGPVTFHGAPQRAVVARVPLERTLVETDAPYLTPVPYRGRRNEPRYVRYVAQAIAELRGLAEEEVAERTTENAEKLFRFQVPSSQVPSS
ncbi:MAG: TatD family hydrolase [Candidatus Bipolaricaulia bacterium]